MTSDSILPWSGPFPALWLGASYTYSYAKSLVINQAHPDTLGERCKVGMDRSCVDVSTVSIVSKGKSKVEGEASHHDFPILPILTTQ